jgi:citrate lyase subunit beta/citryl-CoA lyase
LLATPLDPERTVVRLNPVGTPEHEADIAAVRRTEYRRFMLAKSESHAQVRAIDGEVVALIETPRGALAAAEIAEADNVVGLMWGAEDLVAAMGGSSSRQADGGYRDVAKHVRSTVLLGAKATGRFALDAVYLDIPDLDGLRAEASDAAAVGFDGTVALHPTQVPVIRAAYRPSERELTWARAVLEQAPQHRGAFAFEGRMVDAPLLRHAEQIVRRAEAGE